LARYGARGAIAESRLGRREDGKYTYPTKKGVTLVLTAEQLVKAPALADTSREIALDELPWRLRLALQGSNRPAPESC
jgi:hypothetical protein